MSPGDVVTNGFHYYQIVAVDPKTREAWVYQVDRDGDSPPGNLTFSLGFLTPVKLQGTLNVHPRQ